MALTDADVLNVIQESCDVPRPEHFTDRGHCCECADHDDMLRSRDLDSLTISDVGNPGWDPVCFVTDQAFFYYFPALARLALDQPQQGQGWYFEQLLFHLTYEDGTNRRMLAAAARYKEAVLLLLRHVRDSRGALVEEYSCKQGLEQALAIWNY